MVKNRIIKIRMVMSASNVLNYQKRPIRRIHSLSIPSSSLVIVLNLINLISERFHVRDAQPSKDSDTHTKENALYDPLTTSQNNVSPSSTGKSKSRLSQFFKKKTASIINNNAIAIFALICLVQCLQVVTVSVHEEKRNTTIECHPIIFYSSVASNITYL